MNKIKNVKMEQEFNESLLTCSRYLKKLWNDHKEADNGPFFSHYNNINHIIFKGSSEEADQVLDFINVIQRNLLGNRDEILSALTKEINDSKSNDKIESLTFWERIKNKYKKD